MALNFDKNGTALTTPNHVAAPINPRASGTFPSRPQSPKPVIGAAALNVSSPVSMQRGATEDNRLSSLPLASPSTQFYKQMSMPLNLSSSSAPTSALDESISFLNIILQQLEVSRDGQGLNPLTLQREIGHVVNLLTDARSNANTSALEVQRTLQQDLKRRARSSVGEDSDVIKWISSQYNAPSRSIDEPDETAASPLPSSKPVESEASHNFRSTILCMRWIKKVRESTHRRALKKSPYELILRLSVTDPIRSILSHVDDWDFDLFALEKLAGNRVLSVLFYYLLEVKLGFMKRFGIKPAFFANYIAAIEDGYRDVPYHSHIHAADVLQNTYWLLTRESQRGKITDLDLFSGLIAASIHDYMHPGTNNAFQILTGAQVALRYNDKSVLENMHVSEALLVSKKPHHNIFSGLKAAEKTEARATIINMVLATDMSNHFKNLAELKSQIDTHKTKNQEWLSSNANDRMICVETALHCADLGNPTKSLPIYLEWTERVMQEFYAQGDRERDLGVPISPMMDRFKPSVERSQIGFIDFIVKPLFEAYAGINTELLNSCLEECAKNREYFAQLVAKLPPVGAAPAPAK